MACKSNFISNAACSLYRVIGHTKYGQAKYSLIGKFPVGLSMFKIQEKENSIRADRSAAKAMSYTDVIDARLAIVPSSKIQVGDLMLLKGKRLKVIWTNPAYDLIGILDHYDVGLNFFDEERA